MLEDPSSNLEATTEEAENPVVAGSLKGFFHFQKSLTLKVGSVECSTKAGAQADTLEHTNKNIMGNLDDASNGYEPNPTQPVSVDSNPKNDPCKRKPALAGFQPDRG